MSTGLSKILPFSHKNKVSDELVPNADKQLMLMDVLAPAEMEIDFNFLRINSHYIRTFFVSNYPRYVDPNWLEPLISFDHSLDISMFIYPSQSKNVLDDLKKKIAEMEATIQTDIERGRAVDPAVQLALDDAQALQDQLVKGAERFFRFGLYISVPAENKNELNDITKLVQSTLGSLSITAKTTDLQMEEGFVSTLPLAQDKLVLTHNMDTTSLATTFPFTSSELTANEGIMYGINAHNDSLIIFDRFTLENANSVVFAKSGGGKSLRYGENVLIKSAEGVKLVPIGSLVEGLISKHGSRLIEKGIEGVIDPLLQVWTFDKNLKGQWSNVTVAARKKFSPRNRLYKITTKSGRQITVTADHNLVVMRKGKIRVMRSEAIKIGEPIPLPRFMPDQENSVHSITPKGLVSDWPDFLPQTINLDKNMLILLGLVTSEGLARDRVLRIYNLDPEVNLITEHCSKAIGAKTSILKTSGMDLGRAINPNHYARLFSALGASGKSGEKHLPPIILSLSNKQIACYLRAYFEGDGGVESHAVTATTKSDQLASDLVYLFLRFGIIARIHQKQKVATNTVKKNAYYQITISGRDNLKKFASEIGFLTDKKTIKLSQLLAKSEVANTNSDLVPTLQPIFKYLYRTLFSSPEAHTPSNIVALKNGLFEPSREELSKFIFKCEKRLEELRSLHNQIQLLKSLPSLENIISIGSRSRSLNKKLWQVLGHSWRIMKNSIYNPLATNALLAYQTISDVNIGLPEVNKALYDSFRHQGVSLLGYNKSLWSSIMSRKTGNSRFLTISSAANFITKKYRSTQLKIRHSEAKLAELKLLANSDLFWDPIAKIERIKHKDHYVYDLQVDNGVFLAGNGGVFVHNSYFVKLEAVRSLMFGADIIIIDPEQEYLPLTKAVGGQYINFSSESPVKINPFDLSNVVEAGENELGRKILTLTGFLKLVMGTLDASQAAVLDRALTTTYRLKGITADPATQRLAPPLMEDLYKVLVGMEEPQAQELAFRMEKFIKGSLSGIFSAASNLNLNNPWIVFSVRDLADQLRPLAMYLILDYIWTKIRTKHKKSLLIVDEAWYMMQNADSADFLVQMAKRARKYYLGVTTITQDVEDFLGTDKGKEIISNSSIQVLFKQAPASIDKIGEVFNLSEGEKRLLLSAGVGQGLFFAGSTHVAMSVVASPEEHMLITSNPAETSQNG